MPVKKSLNEGDVTAETLRIHREMVDREARASGDTESAMRRLEARYGLDYWSQWVCRYKRTVTPQFATKLHGAYLDLVERSVRRDLEALKIEQAKGAADDDVASLVAEAKTLLAKIAARKAGVR
ncbi:MAG TPA: hypothetical protein VK862_14810 [Afifellaceae bacterium]|nr:hypothetical protein [Afifellaceae bacterium]